MDPKGVIEISDLLIELMQGQGGFRHMQTCLARGFAHSSAVSSLVTKHWFSRKALCVY